MFSLFNKKPKGETVSFKIDGMHCTSCSLTIDGELEDLEGVIDAKTSYAKSRVEIEYDKEKVGPTKLEQTIKGLGYSASKA
jgi:copper chaperone CopZ